MLEIGSVVDGKYKILSEIGHGGMSVVYMALNEKANKTWAIKEIRKDGELNFEAVKQGLVVETDMMKRLKHPNLPSIVDVIEDDDTFLIVMDYIEGNSLNKILNESGAQPQEEVIKWAKQLCDVLGYLHTRTPAIIYRDMKPANIMIKPTGEPMLIDFGTAREYKEKNLEDTTCLGTKGYAAPEQYGGMGQTDARTDIYCLGATLYHLVTGHNPSEPPYEMVPIREINPMLSSGLEKIILKCTRQNPNERYQSASELMYDLEHYEEIDDLFRRKQVRKLVLFSLSIFMSIFALAGGLLTRNQAAKLATDTYDTELDRANQMADMYDERRKIYLECIELPDKGGDIRAYEGLMDVYQNNDGIFTKEEANELIILNSNHEEELKASNSYSEFSYLLGTLYWYYYDYEGESIETGKSYDTRAMTSMTWFSKVEEDYEFYNRARAYYNIGDFYTQVKNALDPNKPNPPPEIYKELYESISELTTNVLEDDNTNAIVRLELIEFSITAIDQYSTSMKGAGVQEQELLPLCDTFDEQLVIISGILDSSYSERIENTRTQLAGLRTSINGTYGTEG